MWWVGCSSHARAARSFHRQTAVTTTQGAGAAVILPPTTESPDPGFKEWYAAQVESGLVKPLEVKTPSSKPVAPPEEQVVRAPQRMPLPA